MPASHGNPQFKMRDPGTYQIVVAGAVSPGLRLSLAGMSASERTDENGQIETVLVGRLQDQAELSGVLNSLYEMHLPIVSATCLDKS